MRHTWLTIVVKEECMFDQGSCRIKNPFGPMWKSGTVARTPKQSVGFTLKSPTVIRLAIMHSNVFELREQKCVLSVTVPAAINLSSVGLLYLAS